MNASSHFTRPPLPLALAAAAVLLLPVTAQTPPRGEPIKPLAPRGEPIKPLAPKPDAPADKPAAGPAAGATAAEGEFVTVGFDKLSTFQYDVPEEVGEVKADAPDPDKQIPPTVKELNGRRVSLKGFMLPLKVEQGLVTELLIMRDQSMCCYGTVPKINEWVSVKMTGKGVKPVMDQAVTMMGTLKVGAIRENGYLVGIYEMAGEKMAGPAGL